MAAGVSSPARPSPVHLHDPLSHTNNNSSNFNSASPQRSAPTSSSPSLTSLTCPPPAAPPPTPLLSLSSASNQGHPRRPPPSVSPNSTAASTPTTLASSPLSSSPLDPATDSVLLTRSRPQQSPVGSARGDPRLQKPGGFFAFAASAIDLTQSAIATISDQTVRHQRSLSRLSITGDSAAHHLSAKPSPDKTSRNRPASTLSSASSSNLLSPQPGSKSPISQGFSAQDPPYSRPYSETDPSHPPPILLPRIDNKMHQTSSRLLRMTDDDRPFTKVSSLQSDSFLPAGSCAPEIAQQSATAPLLYCAGAAARPGLRIRRLTVACRTSRISLQH